MGRSTKEVAFHQIHNSNHTNKLPSGQRIVQVISVGRRWARVRPFGSGRTVSLPIEAWRAIDQGELKP